MIELAVSHNVNLLLWEQATLELQTFGKRIIFLYLRHSRERKEERQQGQEEAHSKDFFENRYNGIPELRKTEINECRKAASVLEAMDGCWDAATTIDEDVACKSIDGHNRGIAEEATKLYHLSYSLADDGNDADGSGLLVDHTDGSFVSNDAGNGGGRCIAWDSNHVEANRTYAGHGFEFFDG